MKVVVTSRQYQLYRLAGKGVVVVAGEVVGVVFLAAKGDGVVAKGDVAAKPWLLCSYLDASVYQKPRVSFWHSCNIEIMWCTVMIITLWMQNWMPSHRTVFFDTSNSKLMVTLTLIQACSIQRSVDALHYSNMKRISKFMTSDSKYQDDIKRGNPTKLKRVNALFRTVRAAEVAGKGAPLHGMFFIWQVCLFVCLFVCSNYYYLFYIV